MATETERSGLPLALPDVERVLDDVFEAERRRITSYNVCYTKLLRPLRFSCQAA